MPKSKDKIVENLKNTLQSTSPAPLASYHYPSSPPQGEDATASSLPLPFGMAGGTAPGGAWGRSQDVCSTSARVTENLQRALATNERTNVTGHTTVQVLGEQTEVIQNSLETVRATRGDLGEARRTIRSIRWGVYQEYVYKGLVVFFLLCLLAMEIYLKFLR